MVYICEGVSILNLKKNEKLNLQPPWPHFYATFMTDTAYLSTYIFRET